MASVTDHRSESAFATCASGRSAIGRARHVAAVHRCWPSWSGRRGVKGEAMSLLHPFFDVSPSLAFPLANQAAVPPSPSHHELHHAHSLPLQHHCPIARANISALLRSITSTQHCSRLSLGEATF